MNIHGIAWDNESITHIARHGVEPFEVEDVLFDGVPHILKMRQSRYAAYGQTRSGRYLTIIFELLKHKAYIITTRAMSEAERKFYKRR